MVLKARGEAWNPGRGVRRLESAAARRSDRRRTAPVIEALESRQLLSFYTGPSRVRPVLAPEGAFLIQVEGPGVVKVHPAGQGEIDLIVFGTSTSSTVSIDLTQPRYHFPTGYLPIHDLRVTTGQLGNLEASQAELTGKMTPLSGSVTTLDLGALGPKAQVDVNGGVSSFDVQTVNLGPTGHVVISNNLSTSEETGSVTIGTMNLDGGRFSISPDSLGPFSIQGDLTINQDGELLIGRDFGGFPTIGGSVVLDGGGQIVVGRNLTGLGIGGNLIVSPAGSGISVGGELDSLTIVGYFQGQGGTSAPTAFDLGVGLNLNGLDILGSNGIAGLYKANIRAGGSITGVSIPYGESDSTIQPNTPPPT